MDPFTIALATFGVQKLRGKSTKRALRDAALFGIGSYGIGQATSKGMLGGSGGFLGSIGQGKPLSGIGSVLGKKGMSEVAAKEALGKGASEEAIAAAMKGSGLKGMGTGSQLMTASMLLPFLEGEEETAKPQFTEEDYKQAYKEQSQKLEGGFEPGSSALPSDSEIYGQNMFYANEGGLAEVVKKFNTGGVSYLPSKVSHDENDLNNYVRAEGYVEDGSGVGDKDEDTMLAQLADGEFVSRADAVLGAGILSGGDPKNFKSMRKAGANFFYKQQKDLKRVFDLVNANTQK